MPKKIKPKTFFGQEYVEVRKVNYDECWHLCYEKADGTRDYERVDKKTALAIADRI